MKAFLLCALLLLSGCIKEGGSLSANNQFSYCPDRLLYDVRVSLEELREQYNLKKHTIQAQSIAQ